MCVKVEDLDRKDKSEAQEDGREMTDRLKKISEKIEESHRVKETKIDHDELLVIIKRTGRASPMPTTIENMIRDKELEIRDYTSFDDGETELWVTPYRGKED